MIQVQVDKSQLADVQRAVYGIKNGHKKVLTRAVNKTMVGVRTDSVQEVYNVLSLTKTRIRKDFKITKMTFGAPVARISSTGKPISLTTFSGTRQIKAGVSVKIKRSGARKVIKHAFIESVKGSKQAFRREYRGPRSAIKPGFVYAGMPARYRYPIQRLTGPRIQDVYDDHRVMKTVLKKADDRLSLNLNRELNYELSKH